ncbi:uncharacterized protein LOC117517605 [Thalassophryne amazonica]|uniref:uncharacterized protein LOC117517605 n=1 Tax=Thalassophryne amazonica TaxID=390379 RepID=UPI001472154E|nr:uncharacterized protein LOC117517605 [Thalassophryne amazonica]
MSQKEQQLGSQYYEDRGRQLRGLPVLSTDFQSWLNLTDWNRLHAAFWDMHAYWNMLDWKRKQLEKEALASRLVHSTLPQSFKNIQLYLRDLMSQVSSQMSRMNSSWIRPTSPPAWTPPNLHVTSERLWDSWVQGYDILRDLDLYLTKLARDFLLLAAKTHV